MKTIREATRGKLTLRLLETKTGYLGALIGAQAGRPATIDGTDAEDVWRRLEAEAGKSDRSYFGFDGARSRFLQFYPQGFASPGYSRDERDYKLAARAKLLDVAPFEEALRARGLGLAVFSVFSATNLLSLYEKTWVRNAFHGPASDDIVRAMARFAQDASQETLIDLRRLLARHDCDKWTVVTYLPFLWRPDAHIFLKPEVTKDFSLRVGHPFHHTYQARLEMPVYESLLDLAAQTRAAVHDLGPRDNIDVQSFIWVVGASHDPADATQAPPA